MSEHSVLQPNAIEFLRRLSGSLIGENSAYGVPGADDSLIFSDVLPRALDDISNLPEKIIAVCNGCGGVEAVVMLSDLEFQDFVVGLKQRSAGFLAEFSIVLVRSYYKDPRVLISLNKDARPPFPKGNALAQGDWSLLAPVQKRGQIYRKC
jgi:hypothetical protein